LLALAQLFLARGEAAVLDRPGADDDEVGPAGGQLDGIILQADRRRGLDPLHPPAVAQEVAARQGPTDHPRRDADLREELPTREWLVRRVDPAEPLQIALLGPGQLLAHGRA